MKRVAAKGPVAGDRLAQDLDRYLALAVERGVGEGTLGIYRRDLEEYLSFLRGEGATALWMADPPLLRRWFSALRGRGLSSGSVARRAKVARTFTRFVLGGYQDPFVGVRMPRPMEQKRRILTREEIERLLAAAGNSAVEVRDRAVVAVLYATGLRVAELVSLDLRQVDLSRGQILRFDDTGAMLPAFLGRAVEALRDYLQVARPVLLNGAPERALFVSRESSRLSARAVEHLVRRRAEAAGLRATPRDLRATCAAHLREGGATALAVRRLLGTSLTTLPRSNRTGERESARGR